MSRLAKKPIPIPEKTEVSFEGHRLKVKGPLGELVREFKPLIKITVKDGAVVVEPTVRTLETRALSGTYASHIMNMFEGVQKVFEKKLIIEGIGYKAEIKGEEVVLAVGFTHL